ncbi:FAD-dependent oxidoreductase [Halorarius litoreus]|uniref:FAD-dependent oxidoreductase n=1 Tax=Halorarius litoreus TaxID=2962676 RepID=UPI0020CCC552|nr:FAD-dependent oxidoreductase [Halorarius litoreus]
MDPTDTRVAAVREVGPDAVALDLETPDGFVANPGQFVKLTATVDGDDESRFYTISSPDVEGSFELTISYDPEEGGAFSEYLVNIEPGDTVTITGPFGSDFYEGEERVLVLAGGPGVGPAVGIAEAALADGHDVAVVYLDEAPMHEERLAGVSSAGGQVFVLADEDAVAGAVAEVYDDAQQLFVYGFADFIDLATEAVEAAGGSTTGAKVESFG